MHHQNQFGTGNYAGRPVSASNKNPHINLRDPVLPKQTILDSELFTPGGLTRPQSSTFPVAPSTIIYVPVPTNEPAPSSKNGTSTDTTSRNTTSRNNTSRNTSSSSHSNNRTGTRKSTMSSPVRHLRSVYKKQPYPKSAKKTSRSLPEFCKLPSFRKASTLAGSTHSSITVDRDSSSSMARPHRISMTIDAPSSSSSSSSSFNVSRPTEESSVSRPKSIGRINMVPFRPVANRRAPIPENLSSKDKASSHGQSVSASNSFVDDIEMDVVTSFEQDLHPLSSKAIMHDSSVPMEDILHPPSKWPHFPDQVSRRHIISMTPSPLSSLPSTHPQPSPVSPSATATLLPPLSATPSPPHRTATPIDFRTSFNPLSVNYNNHKSVHDTQTHQTLDPASKDSKTETHARSQAPTTPPTTPPFYSFTSHDTVEKVHYVDDQFEYDECLITKVVSPTEGVVYYNSDTDVDNRAVKVKDEIKDEIKSEEHHGPKKTLKITEFFHSDGSRSRFPQHPNVRELQMDDKRVQEWLSRAMLTSLPHGYRLFEELRTRKCLLFGHVEGAFKDPEQFIPHALWLSSADYASLECGCRVCFKGQHMQPTQDQSLLPFQINVNKGTGTISYDLSSCTYCKDSPIFDIPPKIKQDLTKNKRMDMDTEDSKVEEMEGDSCPKKHKIQSLREIRMAQGHIDK
ncbi:hypothetical protein BGZ81_002971 [Podila clonocystis]|nr:hypothetical protein BGZ81_002971 [Podila clonocystis]